MNQKSDKNITLIVVFAIVIFFLYEWLFLHLYWFIKGHTVIEAFFQKDFPDLLSIPQYDSKSVLLGAVTYILGVGAIKALTPNTRLEDAYGSASFGSIRSLRRKYEQKNRPNEYRIRNSDNILLSKHMRMGIDGYKTQRNTNNLVVAASGAGKTRSFAIPNMMQMCSSYVVLDPKGEIYEMTSDMMKANDYKVKLLDLVNLKDSMCYNPFFYVRSEQDVLTVINNYVSATDPEDKKSNDPFWEKAEVMMLYAISFLVFEIGEEHEKNMNTVIKLVGKVEVLENEVLGDAYASELDYVFHKVHAENPDSLAYKYFRDFRELAPDKTARTILLTIAVRLSPFNIPEIKRIVSKDEMDIAELGMRKQVLYLKIPDGNPTFYFLVSMMYYQLFQELYYQSDYVLKKRLPNHVHVIMDEFANIKVPDNMLEILGACRSRNIGVSVIVQSLSQLMDKFKKNNGWQTAIANCDQFVFLGGHDDKTCEYISKRLGKATVNTRTTSTTRSKQGSSSRNFQQVARDLMTMDEVQSLDRGKSIVFIAGEKGVIDSKYDLTKHPRYKELNT